MAGTLSVQTIQGLATAVDPTTVSIATGHKLVGAHNGSIYAPGNVVQVVRHDWTTQTVTSTSTFIDATDGSVTITPIFSSSKLLVVSELAMAPYYPGGSYSGMAARILRDGILVSLQSDTHEVYHAPGTDLYSRTVKSLYLNSNAITASTFKIQIAGYAATSQARLNQASQWNSNITIWEIAQ